MAGAWAGAIGDGVDAAVLVGIGRSVNGAGDTPAVTLSGWGCGGDAGTGSTETDTPSGRATAEVDRGGVASAEVTTAGSARGVVAAGEKPLPVVAGSDVGVSICWGIVADMLMSGGGDRLGKAGISDAPMNIPVKNTIDMKKNRTAVRANRPRGSRLIEGSRALVSFSGESQDPVLLLTPGTALGPLTAGNWVVPFSRIAFEARR